MAKEQKWRRNLCFLLGLALFLGAASRVQGAGAGTYKTQEYYNSTGLDLINAAGAYIRGYTGQGITLGICDLYVKLSHPAFTGKAGSYTLVPIPDNFNWKVYEHGTRVASIMAATKDNTGMQGVAFDANLVSGTWFDPRLYETTGAFVKIVQNTYGAFNTLNNVKIINNSWAITGPGSVYLEWMGANKADILQFYKDQGVDAQIFENSVKNYDKVLVFAAGNSGNTSPHAFALLPYTAPDTASNTMVAVMIDPVQFDKATNTAKDYFLGMFSDLPKYVEENSLAAPGWNINSAIAYGDTYGTQSGTSFAAPHVTAVAGLVQQAFPYMSGKQIVDTVLSTANKTFSLPTYAMTIQSDYMAGSFTPTIRFNLFYFGAKPDAATMTRDLTNFYNANQSTIQSALQTSPDDVITLEKFLNNYARTMYDNVPREMIFGQGLLDAEAAVRGPGLLNARRLDSTSFSPASAYKKDQALYAVDTQGYSSVWSNNIGETRAGLLAADSPYADLQAIYNYYRQGDALNSLTSRQEYIDAYNAKVLANGLKGLPVGLIKSGLGTLALTGANTYQGSSIAADGVLQIDGSVAGDAYSVEKGTIAGSGTIGSHLYNRSILQAGSYGNPGTLTVSGNLESSGQIAVAVKNGSYGKIVVAGSATVSGTSFAPAGGSVYQPDTVYGSVLTAGSITGNFTTSAFTGMLSASGSHDGTSAALTLQRANNLDNPTSRQMQAYNQMQFLYGQLTKQSQQHELDLLYSLNASQAKQALTEIYGGAQLNQAAFIQRDASLRKAVAARLDAASQPETQTLAVNLPGFAPGGVPDKMLIPLQLDAKNSWWLNISKNWGFTAADQELPKLDNQSLAFVLGSDKKISDQWRMGMVLKYANSTVASSLAKTAGHDYRLGTYAGYKRGAVELQTQLDYGRQKNNATRYLPELGLQADSNYDSNTLSLGVRARYNLTAAKKKVWQVSPYADVNVTWYNQDAYQENGAGSYNQAADSLRNTYSTGEIGIELARRMSKGRLRLTLGYKRVLGGNNPELGLAYSGNPDSKLTVGGNEQDRECAVIGFGYEGELAKDWMLQAQIDSENGRQSSSYTGSLMLQRTW